MSFPHWASLDGQRREAFERAINVSNAGSVLIQNFTNRIIEQLSIREFGALGTSPSPLVARSLARCEHAVVRTSTSLLMR